MTEDEAKTKWCPHMFPAIEGQKTSGHNCYGDDIGMFHCAASKCIASDCMMWQVTDKAFGYCGLASGRE